MLWQGQRRAYCHLRRCDDGGREGETRVSIQAGERDEDATEGWKKKSMCWKNGLFEDNGVRAGW